MNNYDFSKAFDGTRLTKMLRASVHSDGKLCFPPEVARHLGLSLEKVLLITPMGEKDFAVVVVGKDTPLGFKIKKTGPYYYVPFKSLMLELGIDFRGNTVVFDIIELADTYAGSPVYKFNRRIIEHEAGADAEGEVLQGDAEEEDPAPEGTGVAGETAAGEGGGVSCVSGGAVSVAGGGEHGA